MLCQVLAWRSAVGCRGVEEHAGNDDSHGSSGVAGGALGGLVAAKDDGTKDVHDSSLQALEDAGGDGANAAQEGEEGECMECIVQG